MDRRPPPVVHESGDLLSYQGIPIPLSVLKPWGHEVLLGRTELLEVWQLWIAEDARTSYHYHPSKETLLIVLDGQGVLAADTGQEPLEIGRSYLIEKGAPHQLQNHGSTSLVVVEVEMPPNKNDLVRLDDSYGRVSRPYLYGSRISPEAPCQALSLLHDARRGACEPRVELAARSLFARPASDVPDTTSVEMLEVYFPEARRISPQGFVRSMARNTGEATTREIDRVQFVVLHGALRFAGCAKSFDPGSITVVDAFEQRQTLLASSDSTCLVFLYG